MQEWRRTHKAKFETAFDTTSFDGKESMRKVNYLINKPYLTKPTLIIFTPISTLKTAFFDINKSL